MNFNRTTKTCDSCSGVVSQDYLKCDACPATNEDNHYFDKTTKVCTFCPGALEDVDYPTACTDCTAGKYFDKTDKQCKACGLRKNIQDILIPETVSQDKLSCVECKGQLSVDGKTCDPCPADKPYFHSESLVCEADCPGILSADSKVCNSCH